MENYVYLCWITHMHHLPCCGSFFRKDVTHSSKYKL
jgi:hypothetical protein